MFKYFLFFYLLFLIKSEELTSLRVIYLTPQDEDTIYNLNEKSTFGNDYINGWILPSTQKLTLNLYLYYDGVDVQSLIQIYNLYNRLNTTTNVKSYNSSGNSIHSIKETLYVYFTTQKANCDDYRTEQHIPLKFMSKLADNMYKAQITIRLTYADSPYFICMQQIDTDENIYDQNRHFHHQGTSYWLSIITTKDLMPLWSRLLLFFILLSLSGLFSGLNLGLMSLDVSELVLLKRIGTDKERSFATKIYPLRKRGNFLLCTILLGNVLVNSTSTLILGDLLSGIYAAFGSTILIVLFGEIIPQAACSKHGLAVGAYTRYITIFFMGLTSPISYPLSLVLDYVLGQEIAATYNRDKIRELMKNVKDLEENERKMISGVLDFNQREVKDIMTPLSEVFMLDMNSKLDFETIVKIQQKGFSRIPVYEASNDNVVGLLHFKDFTLLDPDDNMPVKALLDHYNHKVEFCDTEDKLYEMFERFCLGEAHLAFVREVIHEDEKDPYLKCVGIVTLEDVIEELVQEEIYDEFDEKEISHLNVKNTKHGSANSIVSKKDAIINRKYSYSNRESKNTSKSNSNSAINLVGCVGNTASSSAENVSLKKEVHVLNKQPSVMSGASSSNQKSSSNASKVPKYEPQTSYDLSFFLQQIGNQSKLISPQLSLALFQFLSSSVKPFNGDFLTKNVLELIFKCGDVFKESRRAQDKGIPEYLYQYGKRSNYFIIILTGEATIEVGIEKLEFIAGQFAYFGANGLLNDCDNADQILRDVANIRQYQYIPDFSLRVDDRCVYFKIDRDLWLNGVKKSKYEIENSEMSTNIDLSINNNSIISNPVKESSTADSLLISTFKSSNIKEEEDVDTKEDSLLLSKSSSQDELNRNTK